MQAIILAAGKSTRTYPLTLTRPKPLLKILNKPILEHLLDELIKCGIKETIVIVKYKKDMIIDYYGDSYNGMKLIFAEQSEQLGTLHALHEIKHLIKDRFLVLYGDDLVHSNDLKKGLQKKYSLFLFETKFPERFGIAKIKGNKLIDMVEKPKQFIGNLASGGGFVFDRKIFDYPLELEPGQKEYYIPTMLKKLCKDDVVEPIMIEEYYLPTGYCWDLLTANEFLIKRLSASKIDGVLEENVAIKGNAHIEKGTIVKSGSYLEGNIIIGENCVIGPNAYLRNGTTIGNNCKIGNAVEIKNSIIMDNTSVGHLSYIGDSVLGENVNIGAGTITANLRHACDNVKSMHNNILIDTGRRKFGTIISDNAKTGINTSIYPGRKLWPCKTTLPGEIVKKDVI